MLLRKSMVGVIFAIAMFVCALAVSSASAATAHLETCKEKPTAGTITAQRYNSSTCTVKESAGNFTKVQVSEVASATIANSSVFSLAAVVGGINFKISCEKVSGTSNPKQVGTEKVVAENFALTFTGCTVAAPTGKGCVVKGGSGAATGTIITNAVNSTTTRPSTEETYRQAYVPKTGTLFVTINVSGCTGTAEALNGNKEVTGEAVATINSEGMEANFTSTSGSKLFYAGQSATFLGSAQLDETGGNYIFVGP